MLDSILSTAKTILIQNNKAILSAIVVYITQVIFYYLIQWVGNGDSVLIIQVISTAAAFGVFVTIKINDRFSKDKTYVNMLFCDNIEVMRDFHHYLTKHKVTHQIVDSYAKDLTEKTFSITAIAETRCQSKVIDKYVEESNEKIKRVIY